MSFDFSKIQVQSQQAKPTDPIEIFQASAVTDGNINDLWLAQGDALREWNDHRALNDVAVVLNTGAGKTLVGLLIAQSLVNETRRKVVYACNSIQLVEQTANKARDYGLPATTYYHGKFSPDGLYHRAEAPCVTTYQALFNGKTRFRSGDVAAVIFDDAHTAEHILRDQFSLSIARAELTETYEQIVALFRPYHDSVGLESSYAEVSSGESSSQFFAHPSEVRRNVRELRRLLLSANLREPLSTMFSWEHIRDHEDLCCLLISDKEVTLTPPVVPVSTLPYFNKGVRRVYLSATLSAPDSFVRAFGRQPDRIVAPSTTAGECERMILIPSVVEGVDDDDVASAKEVIKDKKALILVPSFSGGKKWSEIAQPPPNVPQAVDSFRNAKPPKKLILAARYDGIDLPGDTCRMMVLDELPTGSGPLERFQWERLNMQNSLRSMLASRIVQSFGRISRGMSDHGVVLLTGKGLVEWLLLPRNRSLLPKFLQKQIQIGEDVSKSAQDTDGLASAAAACLDRAPGWIQFYTDNMRDLSSESDPIDMEKALEVALAEARFGKAFWDRDFQSAAGVLDAVLPDAFEFSQYTGAWLSLWLGFAFEMGGDDTNAAHFYGRAYVAQSDMPRHTPSPPATATPVPPQVSHVAEQMRIGHSNSISVEIPKTITQDLVPLNGNGSWRQTEEALRCLGQYLGLRSTRPDNESGTGPDVLWLGEDGAAVCMEVKTGKQQTSFYRKDYVGQLHNHVQWVKDNHQPSEIIPVFVGPLSPTTDNASPSPDMKVVELQQFMELGDRLVSALWDAAVRTTPLSLNNDLYEVMKTRGLLYPDVFSSLDASILRDIPTRK